MSTDGGYSEKLPRRGPAFGYHAPPPERIEQKETPGPLDRKTEAARAVAITAPVLAAYAAIGYAVYEAINGSL